MPMVEVSNGGTALLEPNTYIYMVRPDNNIPIWTDGAYSDGVPFSTPGSGYSLIVMIGVRGKNSMIVAGSDSGVGGHGVIGFKSDGTHSTISLSYNTTINISDFDVIVINKYTNVGTGALTITVS